MGNRDLKHMDWEARGRVAAGGASVHGSDATCLSSLEAFSREMAQFQESPSVYWGINSVVRSLLSVPVLLLTDS